jgi:hypothetical protein
MPLIIIIIQFFIIYVLSQQLQGQLQTQHSEGTTTTTPIINARILSQQAEV